MPWRRFWPLLPATDPHLASRSIPVSQQRSARIVPDRVPVPPGPEGGTDQSPGGRRSRGAAPLRLLSALPPASQCKYLGSSVARWKIPGSCHRNGSSADRICVQEPADASVDPVQEQPDASVCGNRSLMGDRKGLSWTRTLQESRRGTGSVKASTRTTSCRSGSPGGSQRWKPQAEPTGGAQNQTGNRPELPVGIME